MGAACVVKQQAYITYPCGIRLCEQCHQWCHACPDCRTKQKASYPEDMMVEIRGRCPEAAGVRPLDTL